jgi:Sec-independent protein translocase protein TatA
VGLGTEILFMLMLGLLVLGPKQLHALLGHVTRAKAQFEEASRGFKSQLAAELDAVHQEGETDSSNALGTSEPCSDSVSEQRTHGLGPPKTSEGANT